MTLIRSVSGVRGIVGEGLTPEVVTKYLSAFADMLPETGWVAVGRDGRRGGEWIERIVVGTLQAKGRSVANLQQVPTPTVQLFVERFPDVVGGVVITASHNPAQWNGLKFLNADGVFLSQSENQRLWELLEKANTYRPWNQIGTERIVDDAIQRHIDAVLGVPVIAERRERIAEQNWTVVVDAVNAAGSVAVPTLLQRLGCQAIPLYCDGTGNFPHTPEPLPQHLAALRQAVVAHQADFGVAVDPDADRLVLVDNTGSPVWEEYTIVLAALAVMRLKQSVSPYQPVVVVNQSTTQAVDDVAAQYGWRVERSPVGEINVVQKMKHAGAAVGGEGSGGVILPDCHYGRDSLVGIALILTLLADQQVDLATMVQQLPHYVMRKLKVPAHGEFQHVAERLQTVFRDATTDFTDGVKFRWKGRWLHLRPSNTEPIWRIIAEAPDEQAVTQLVAQVQQALGVAV